MWLEDSLRVNAAVFYTTIDDNQFFEFFAGPFGLMRVVTTIDEVEISGFEMDFNWALHQNFRLFGGIGLLSSEIKKNLNRPLSEGNDAPQTPEETYNLGAQFDMPLGDQWNLMARVDWQYVGDMWFHTLQGEEVPTIWAAFPGNPPLVASNMGKAQRDAYNTLDARLSLGNENWLFTLWGRNLTDENYLQEVIPAPEFGGSFIHPSAQRTYGIEASYQF